MTFQTDHVARFFGEGDDGLSFLEESLARNPLLPIESRDALEHPTVAVIGLGYVGLPTAMSLTQAGSSVIGVDIARARLDAIRAGAVDGASVDHDVLRRSIDSGALELTDDFAAVGAVDAVIICVPTPVDGAAVPDVVPLEAACAAVVANARPGQLIILTSTTYVGCTRALLQVPLEARGFVVGEDISVAFCPERLNPGSSSFAHDEVVRVIGGVTPACSEAAASLLSSICPGVHVVSSPETAELSKLIENTFRAVNIALVNEFAEASRALGVDAVEALEAAASKPYGFMAFQPGPGVGGHCIPCDPHYLLWRLRAERVSSPLIEQAMAVLASRPVQVADRAAQVLASRGIAIDGARILLSGLAYKPGIQDVRESPALVVADVLRRRGATVTAHDPVVGRDVEDAAGVVISENGQPDSGDIDLVIVLTRHPGFDQSWLERMPMVLDATYSLAPSASVVSL